MGGSDDNGGGGGGDKGGGGGSGDGAAPARALPTGPRPPAACSLGDGEDNIDRANIARRLCCLPGCALQNASAKSSRREGGDVALADAGDRSARVTRAYSLPSGATKWGTFDGVPDLTRLA